MPAADQLSDHWQITQLLFRYARAIDSKDLKLLESVFTKDAEIHYDVEGGTRLPLREMIAWLGQVLPLFYATQHAVTNPVIEVDGDTARSTCYLTATHQQVGTDGSQAVFIDNGIYSDRLVRTASGWRIRHRKLNRITCHGDFIPPDEAQAFPGPPDQVAAALASVDGG